MATIMLVEDNPDDEELTRIAFEESNLANQLVVARDGVEALDYLLDPKRRKSLLVNQCVRGFQQPAPHLRIRSAKAPASTPRLSNRFDLLQLSYSLSMNVI